MTDDDRSERTGALRGRFAAATYDFINARYDRKLFSPHRRQLLRSASGRVLDVGAGTGANLGHYPMGQVSRLVLLDPSPGMLARARRKARALGITAEFREASAEELPFADESFDAVVFTLALCTVADPARALGEARRVLAAEGRLLVFEHVRSRDPRLARLQDRCVALQKCCGTGCHPNRDTRAEIERAGFVLGPVEEWVEKGIPLPWVRPYLQGIAHFVVDGVDTAHLGHT